MITLPNGCQLTRDSVERALDQHEAAGLIKRWHNWHEDRPGRKRPVYTVTLAGPKATVIDLATLHEAHAFIVGLVSAHDAWQWRPIHPAPAPAAGVRVSDLLNRSERNRMADEAREAGYASLAEAQDFGWEPSSSDSSL